MSRFDWGTGFAIGLIAGVALALFFLVWAVPEFRDPILASEYRQNIEQLLKLRQDQVIGNDHFWIHRLYGWVYTEDTLAQWLMAIFAMASTFISFLAVVYIRKTLDATVQAVNTSNNAVTIANQANQIMIGMAETEIRPHFKILIEGHYTLRDLNHENPDRPVSVWAYIELQNIGENVAEIVSFHVETIDTGYYSWTEVFETLGKGDALVLDRVDAYVRHIDEPYTADAERRKTQRGMVIYEDDQWDRVMMNPPPIIGRVIYNDISSVRWEYRFAYTVGAIWTDSWLRWGGPKYNGHFRADEHYDASYPRKEGFPGRRPMFT